MGRFTMAAYHLNGDFQEVLELGRLYQPARVAARLTANLHDPAATLMTSYIGGSTGV